MLNSKTSLKMYLVEVMQGKESWEKLKQNIKKTPLYTKIHALS